MTKKSIGVVGARGYVGAELLRLLDSHHYFELEFASSRSLTGQKLSRVVPGCTSDMAFENLTPEEAGARSPEVTVLALPNGLAATYLEFIPSDSVVIDLSADYRFDDSWYYGLPELTRVQAPGKKHISNPGCYATAMQLALAPVRDLLDGPPSCFGISGYSGAGTSPSDSNNPQLLKDNILPYKSVNHIHEKEVSRHLGEQVHFLPNVAQFFRGIAMTVNARLKNEVTADDIENRFQEAYENEALVEFQSSAPRVADIVNQPGAKVGGCVLNDDGNRLVVHSVLDNLLKGAATQALQNLNLACDFSELEGIQYG